MAYQYQLYGINIYSDFMLQGVPIIKESFNNELRILLGCEKPTLSNYEKIGLGLFYNARSDLVLDVIGIATYIITQHTITVILADSIDMASVCNFLMSAAIPYYLILNKKLLLKGAVFTFDGEIAQLLIGHSGVGKSTILASLCLQGAKILSDQFCVLDIDHINSVVKVESGFSMIKLWHQAAKSLSIATESLLPVRPHLKRYYWPAPFIENKLPVANVFVLKDQNLSVAPLLSEMKGAQKVGCIRNYQYAQAVTSTLKGIIKKQQVQILFKLALQANAYMLTRVNAQTTISELTETISTQINEIETAV